MKNLPNFLHLFLPIQNYLAKAPNGTPAELDEAKKAYNEIIMIMYGPDPENMGVGPCTDHVKIVQFSL